MVTSAISTPLGVCRRTARRQIDLANRADVIGEMNYTAGDGVELRLAHVARLAQALEPTVRLRAELVAQLLPLCRGDAGVSPALAPIGIVERFLAGAPSIHQR